MTKLILSCAFLLLSAVNASFRAIAGYEPTSDIMRQSAIDLDQRDIEESLALQTDDGLQQARIVYERTFQDLSISTGTIMRREKDSEFYPDFQKFLDYYGQTDFANDFIVNAFEGGATTSGFTGNFDLSLYEPTVELSVVIAIGTVSLILPLQVIRSLEYAVEKCATSSGMSLASLDEAVAYYVGSLEGDQGQGDGELLYNNADVTCQHFETCDESTGTSAVNRNIMDHFAAMRQDLQSMRCERAEESKTAIAKQIFIPFIQGTLHALQQQSDQNENKTVQAIGMINAAAVLPVVSTCSMEDARTVFEQTKPRVGGNASFVEVNEAFKRNYDCMGISCGDISGLTDDACSQNLSATTTTIPKATSSLSPAATPSPIPSSATHRTYQYDFPFTSTLVFVMLIL